MSSPFSTNRMKDQALQAAVVVQIMVLNGHNTVHDFKKYQNINYQCTRPQIKPRDAFKK